MKTFLLNSEQGICKGFEIKNNFISTSAISRFIIRIPGCNVISKRKVFSNNEIHLTFNYKETEFQVWEPFGDNSRLHIGSDKEINEKIILSLSNAIQKTKCYFIF